MADKGRDDMQKEMLRVIDNMKSNMKKLGDEAKVWARRSEKELGRLSRMGKIEIDLVGMQMKRDKALRSVGERFVRVMSPKDIGDTRLKSLYKEIKTLDSTSRRKKSEMVKVRKELFK